MAQKSDFDPEIIGAEPVVVEPVTIDVAQISGIGTPVAGAPAQSGGRTWLAPNQKVFLVENSSTVEVRTDAKLAALLTEKHASVMQSRYFGAGGIEVVLSGQLSQAEVEDLIRLSYNLTNQLN